MKTEGLATENTLIMEEEETLPMEEEEEMPALANCQVPSRGSAESWGCGGGADGGESAGGGKVDSSEEVFGYDRMRLAIRSLAADNQRSRAQVCLVCVLRYVRSKRVESRVSCMRAQAGDNQRSPLSLCSQVICACVWWWWGGRHR